MENECKQCSYYKKMIQYIQKDCCIVDKKGDSKRLYLDESKENTQRI